MRALTWHGTNDVRVETVPDARIEWPPGDSQMKAATPGISSPAGPRLGARRMSRSVPLVPV